MLVALSLQETKYLFVKTHRIDGLLQSTWMLVGCIEVLATGGGTFASTDPHVL